MAQTLINFGTIDPNDGDTIKAAFTKVNLNATALSNVTNESKATMFSSPTFTGTVLGITKSMVGLNNVDNTTDLLKPLSTASINALALKAPLESPIFTGTINGDKIITISDSYFNGVRVGNGNSNIVTNTVLGTNAGLSLTTGGNNTLLGHSSGLSLTTGIDNTIVGGTSASVLTIGSYNSLFGYGVNSTCIDGSYNTMFGYKSGIDNKASHNTFFGFHSGFYNSTGDYNVFIGQQTGNGVTSGTANAYIGTTAGNIGNRSFCSAIGYNAQNTADNQNQIGQVGTNTYVYGTIQDRSDLRDKADVRDTILGLDFICKLRAVDYKWDMRDSYRTEAPIQGILSDKDYKIQFDLWAEENRISNLKHNGTHKRNRYHHGVIAQEVRDLGIDFGGFQDHSVNGGEDVLSIGYDEFIAPMIKAIQELKAEIESLKAK